MSQVTRPARRRRAASRRSDAPAYWISNKQALAIQHAAESEPSSLADLVGYDARPVPGAKQVETTLVGELLNLLANSGVPLPPARQSSNGILVTLNPAESAAAKDAIDRFMKDAAEETLSRDPSLVLHSEEPEQVRRGIAYLRKGLKIPSGYDALLLLGR